MNRAATNGRVHPLNRHLAVSICMMAALVLFFTACGKEEEKTAVTQVVRPVKVMTVDASGEVSGLKFPGRVRASQRVELAFKVVGGRLFKLPIAGKEGGYVKKGELLARIDPKDFQTDLRKAEGRLKQAEAALDLAESDYARVQRIRKEDPGATSQAMVDRRRETVNQAQGRIKSLKASVDTAKNRLSYTYLRAPYAGVIAKRFVDNFQEVKPKQPIASLEDISHVELLVDVPENVMAVNRAEGRGSVKAVAEFPTSPGKQYPLKVKEFATKADPATQTYQVVLQMAQPEGINVLPGMTATVSISVPGQVKEGGSIFIPAIAVMADPNGDNYVWLVDSTKMTVHKKGVKVGRLAGSENIDVLEGLEGGETLVVAGGTKLQEGMKVSFWEQQ
ncbi:efflux RND transporter periplasmic adaptor subunit [Thermodesulfobacteriota bacterium]